MIDKLDAEIVQSGKEHPFVVMLVKEIRAKRDNIALAAESPTYVNPTHLLGKLAALREVLQMIETAKGRDE